MTNWKYEWRGRLIENTLTETDYHKVTKDLAGDLAVFKVMENRLLSN